MTHTPFATLLEQAAFDGDRFSIRIPAEWRQGRTTYGGLSVAVCLQSAMRAFPDLPPLRSANIGFVGAGGEHLEGRVELVRQGKSVSFVAADLMSEGKLATRCLFAFGHARESSLNHLWSTAPEAPEPQDCENLLPDGVPAAHFVFQFDARLVRGDRPATGSHMHENLIWARHRNSESNNIVALVALADMPPPSVLQMARTFKPVSSMTWNFNMLTDDIVSDDGWWLLGTRAEHAREGYSSQDMMVWNAKRELVMAGRQNVAIFF